MIKAIKPSKSEKILFFSLIIFGFITLGFFFSIKNKCSFVKKINLAEINFEKPENIVLMDVECGNVVIELYPDISPASVKRFKYFTKKGLYDGTAFYRVIENVLVQAGDLEFGNIDSIDYSKIGTGKSGIGQLKSELDNEFNFEKGVLAFARGDELNTEDSEFFIILKDIELYNGEYTPLGKVLFGLDVLKKIKSGNKSEYVLRPDYVYSLKMYKKIN